MKRIFLLTLFSISFLFSKEPLQFKEEPSYEPIFAGSLLAFASLNVLPDTWVLQPYLFVGNVNGTYDANWKIQDKLNNFETQLFWLVETGITSWLDIYLVTNENYTSSHGKKSYLYGDTRVALGFQILKNQINSWIPDFRLILQESFPSGKYQHLNPKKNLAGISGSGAYETWIIAITRKIIYLFPRQPITVNLTLQYNFPSNVHAKGFNLYGGNPTTDGYVKPGNQFIGNLGLEYSLTVNWALGLDIHYQHQNKSRSNSSLRSPLGLPSSEQFSLAPCIEYNFNTSFGLEVGSWFTLAGRNTVSFATGAATAYWFF